MVRLKPKQREAFTLLRAYQQSRLDALASTPSHMIDVASFLGLLNKPLVTEAEACRWPESQCDDLIAHYESGRRRYVW